MSAHGEDIAPAYLVAHLQDALAADPRVGELGVEVVVAHGRLFLTGAVAQPKQRDVAGEIAAALAPGLEVCNDIEVVTSATSKPEPERLT
jgi:osmotically-inducible protein OsmY